VLGQDTWAKISVQIIPPYPPCQKTTLEQKISKKNEVLQLISKRRTGIFFPEAFKIRLDKPLSEMV